MKEKLKGAGRYIYQEGTVYIILVALIVFFSIFNPKFLSSQNLYNLITQSTYIVIAGMGICFVMISGGIDLSVGYQMAVCGCSGHHPARDYAARMGCVARVHSAGAADGYA